MKIRNKIVKLFLFSCLIFLTSCAVNPVTGKQELMLISENQEIELGKKAAPSMKWDMGGAYNDQSLETYLHGIVQQVWQNSERPHLPFTFYIQNTSVPNAFALPGQVAITRGLLSEIENEAQFAAIMGHEAGHVMARHTAQRLSRASLQQMGLAVGGTLLEGTRGANLLMSVGAIGSQLFLLKYDRAQEIQADKLGVRYMAELGYDPSEAVRAHEILDESVDNYMERLGKKRGSDTFMNALLSTHPRKEVRLGEIKAMIQELPPYTIKGNGKFNKRFQEEIRRIKDMNEVYFLYDKAEMLYGKKDYTGSESHVAKAISLNKDQPPFYNLLGFIKIQQKNYQAAEQQFRKAISIDPEYQPSLYGLGFNEYSQKRYRKAVPFFKQSLQVYPDHLPTHLALGKSYFSLNQHQQAIKHLGPVAQTVSRHPEVHGLLGISYEAVGENPLAVREYKYQIQVAPQSELGSHAKKRLAVLEPASK
jgi:predicted Zn-dependent protease